MADHFNPNAPSRQNQAFTLISTKENKTELLLATLENYLYSLQFGKILIELERFFGPSVTDADPVTLLKLKCIQAEVFDYFGRFEEAREVIMEVGQAAEDRLRSNAAQFEDHNKLKPIIWTALHWSLTFYRRNQFIEALRILDLCRDAVDRLPATEAHLTRAKIHYVSGLVYREQHEYRNAKRCFVASMDCARCACGNYVNQDKVTIGEYTIAKCLVLGLAWICYTEGQLTLARPLIIAAQALLAGKAGTLVEQYIVVIDCCVQRASSSGNLEILETIITKLNGAYKVFEGEHHETYKAKAADQLALAYLHQALLLKGRGATFSQALQNAEQCAGEVERFATKTTYVDSRSLTSALIAKSRIYRLRENRERATEEAEKAVKVATDVGDRDKFSRIDAFISMGECFRAEQEFGRASLSFHQALRDGEGNPKIMAMCHLHLSEVYLDQDKIREAEEHNKKAREALPFVEHQYVQRRAEEVQRRLEDSHKGLFLSFDDKYINPDEMERRLHGFLARWAKKNSADDVAAAKLLGKSKATLYNWLKDEPASKYR